MPMGICFDSKSHPLLCHNMTVTIIILTLDPDFNEYLSRDYAASATSFIFSFNRYLLSTYYVLDSILDIEDTVIYETKLPVTCNVHV